MISENDTIAQLELKHAVEAVLSYDLVALKSKSKVINHNAIEKVVTDYFTLISPLKDLRLDVIPDIEITPVLAVVEKISDLFGKILALTSETDKQIWMMMLTDASISYKKDYQIISHFLSHVIPFQDSIKRSDNMQSNEQNVPWAQIIDQSVERILLIERDTLVEFLKQANKTGLIEVFDKIFALLKPFRTINYEQIPVEEIKTATQAIQTMGFMIDRLSEQKLETSYEFVNEYASQIASYYKVFYKVITDFLTRANVIQEDVVEKVKKLEETLSAAELLTAEGAQFKWIKAFDETAIYHQKMIDRWLKYVIGIGCTIVVAIIIFWIVSACNACNSYSLSSNQATLFGLPYSLFQQLILKIALLTALYYLLIFAVKNYRFHQHNYVINQHRQNCVTTFLPLTERKISEETKQQILQRAAEAMFTHHSTGYSSKEGDAIPIIDVLKELLSHQNKR